MEAQAIITLLGGAGWLVILIVRQSIAYRSNVIRSHHYEEQNQ